MTRLCVIAAAILFALPALAAGPSSSLRPVARAGSETLAAIPAAPVALTETATMIDVTRSAQAVARSLRPALRPKAMVQRAMSRRQAQVKGQVCNDPQIQGELVGRVPGRSGGCGIEKAVKVRSVAGVTLSTSATMDCNTASALRRWVEKGAKPAIGKRGGGLSELQVAAHYACRSRNNQPGAKISEHGRGRAIDIAGFRMRDGSRITVLEGWNRKGDGAVLRKMHKAACGPFGTVLGPEADRFHRDHFHFDTARYRSGSYCR